MIQERDKYQGDYTQKYYPTGNLDRFSNEMFSPEKFKKSMIVFTREENDQHVKFYNHMMYQGGAIMAGSIAFIALYNKIPLVKKVQGRWIRKILKISAFFIPIQIHAAYNQQKHLASMMELYQKHGSFYHKYLQNGDILNLCPNIRLSEV